MPRSLDGCELGVFKGRREGHVAGERKVPEQAVGGFGQTMEACYFRRVFSGHRRE